MNQLQRIILINSGNTEFNEIKLDGNIHFIGTQGTGKSTLLRAILFFYNADSRKLGISKEKRNFSDYYFPHADSYIIYEVNQGERRFCVWLYKKQNRLCFRFIDGPYSLELFLSNQQALSESEIIAKAAGNGFKVTRPYFNFSEYRDIIYGANKGLRRYSLTQNQSYHNIPRTISNIFLNSSLDGGFIKKTIINSLSDDVFEINLDKNRRHLESAREDYCDVSEYLKHERKAQNIVEAYNTLLQQEEQQKTLAWQIGAAHNKVTQEKRGAEELQVQLSKELTEQQAKIKRLKVDFSNDIRRTQDKLSNVKRDISKANDLVKLYAAKDIETVLAEKAIEADYQTELAQITAQLEVLKAGSEKVETQYQNSKHKLETECQKQVLAFEKGEQVKVDELNAALNQGLSNFYQEKERLNADYQDKITEQVKEKEELQKKISEIDFQIKVLELKAFFKEEKAMLGEKLQALTLEKQDLQNNSNEAALQVNALTKEGEREFHLLEYKAEQESEKLSHQKDTLQAEMQDLQADIDALSGSFLEFLEKNKPQWEESIGKLIKKDVLLRNDLNPKIESGDGFYGLQLELNELESINLSKTELEKALAEKEKKHEALVKQIRKHQDQVQAEKDKKQKKYNKKIAELKSDEKLFSAKVEQTIIAIEKSNLLLQEFKEKEGREKQEAIAEKENAKYQVEKQESDVTAYIAKLKNEQDKIIAELEKQYKSSRNGLERLLKELKANISSKIEIIEADYAQQLDELLAQRNQLLTEKGADIKHINTLEEKLMVLDEKLNFIKSHLTLIVEYEKDCKDYIHRLGAFRNERKGYEKEIEHKEHLHKKRLETEGSLEHQLQEKLSNNKGFLAELSIQNKRFDQFKIGTLFDKYHTFVEHHDVQDDWHCDVLINTITNVALEYDKNDKSFTERITEFSGYFSQQNHLGFNTNLSNQTQYRAFAENLKEFVSEHKIIDFKTEVTKKYSMVLENIVAETKDLLEHEKEVHKIIQRINNDFKNSNFVGVVKSIEMRLQESTNKIIQLLRKIQLFEAEHSMSFGEMSLFNQTDSGKKDDEAVKLLERLLSQIGQAKTSKISLEDAFDLEFRIRENENDTNWVSRLANVGSNGTDVLVKSMIYINLLHIFKNTGKKQTSDTTLHCLIDEVGILHDSNVTGLITFAGERNIRLINGSPNSHNEQDYKHIYMFRKIKRNNKTGITKLISNEL